MYGLSLRIPAEHAIARHPHKIIGTVLRKKKKKNLTTQLGTTCLVVHDVVLNKDCKNSVSSGMSFVNKILSPKDPEKLRSFQLISNLNPQPKIKNQQFSISYIAKNPQNIILSSFASKTPSTRSALKAASGLLTLAV